MTDLRKAAEMALEALEWNYGTDLENIENCMAWLEKMNATIPALRQALAQPEQEPVGYVTIENISSWARVPSIKWFKKLTGGPLYTAPAKKEWVGLTDDDIHDAFNYVEMVKWLDFDRDRPEWCEAFARACEATLRHRNGEKQ